LYITYYEPAISKVLAAQVRHVLTRDYTVLSAAHTFIGSGISLPLLPRHRTSLHFGWYSFSVPLRVEGWGGLSARRRSPIPAEVRNRTPDHWVASPTP